MVFFIHKKALILSARDMDEKERKSYGKKNNETSAKEMLPENFSSFEMFWNFWDTHSSADYDRAC